MVKYNQKAKDSCRLIQPTNPFNLKKKYKSRNRYCCKDTSVQLLRSSITARAIFFSPQPRTKIQTSGIPSTANAWAHTTATMVPSGVSTSTGRPWTSCQALPMLHAKSGTSEPDKLRIISYALMVFVHASSRTVATWPCTPQTVPLKRTATSLLEICVYQVKILNWTLA